MTLNRVPIFNVIRDLLDRPLTQVEVKIIDKAIDESLLVRAEPVQLPEARPAGAELLTARVALELVGHEAIVLEAYKDNVGVWTWGIGVTSRSGHDVERYKDNPQSMHRVLEVFLWLLREKYIPAVAAAFDGFALTEAQFAAALSFHYNTGAIGKADWVKLWKAGKLDAAHSAIMNWLKPKEIEPRRTKERDLFFAGKWSNDGGAIVYPVRKPSYLPDFRNAYRVNISGELEELLG